jgi:hypothetical protein
LHLEHYLNREAAGVPLLRHLLQTRIKQSPAKKLLGVIAVMSEAAKNPKQLSDVLDLPEESLSSQILSLVKHGLIEDTDDSSLRYVRTKASTKKLAVCGGSGREREYKRKPPPSEEADTRGKFCRASEASMQKMAVCGGSGHERSGRERERSEHK